MESQCDYSMYFPAVPFPPREFLAGESSGYRSLPRRNHLYLGETVRFLLVLRKNPGSADPKSGNADPKSGNVDPKSGNVDPKSGNVDPKSGNADPKSGNVDPKSGNVDPKSGNVDPKSGNVDPKSGNADPKSGNVDPKTGNVNPKSGNVDPKTGNVNPKSGNVDPKSGNVNPKSGNVDPKSGNVDPKSGNFDLKSGNFDPKSGNFDPKSGNVDPKSGNFDPKSANVDLKSGNVDPKTGNVDPKTGNSDPKSGNVDPKSRNADPKTGNADPKTGNADPKSGNVDPKSGNADPKSGNVDPKSGNFDPKSGNVDPKSGNFDPKSGNVDPKSCNSDPKSGNANPKSGNVDPKSGNVDPKSPWIQLASSLSALATVTSGDDAAKSRDEQENSGNFGNDPEDSEEPPLFRECRALLTHSRGPPGSAGLPVDDPIVSQDEVIFPLTVALDRLPPGTAKAKIVVTVWQRDTEPPELQEGTGTGQVTMTGTGTGGYLRLLQGRAPGQVFRQQHGAFKAQVSTLLTVLPPPRVRCRQVTVSGKYLTVLKVLNGSSQEELSLWDVQILPNFNASYLPVMPDGSVLLVDDVCHHSGEVPVGAFCRVPGCHSGWPCPLSALEEQNFLFQLQAPERPPRDAKEGLEVPLVAVVRWSTPKLPFTNSIVTHYRLPSIRLERPRFVMTATCESPVVALQRFTVTYTLLNDLQDFLAVRLVWTPEATAGKGRGALDWVVCHTPLTNLGSSRKGSARTFRVAFQALRAGLFELSQHMKLKLQFTASVTSAPPEARPVSRKSSPSSPAVRELVAGLGRSQSFSHQQPARSHLMRSGSVMERRAITLG
ncbi:trafficking protein particle complex subunit 14 isoform X3 [Cinclus cinclus]|uniref:trafficking protein particle complex subunit 14 isoform X3 n=1 Tax=Cinclus cinclus TaxID=127875 RepID=UPI002E16166E